MSLQNVNIAQGASKTVTLLPKDDNEQPGALGGVPNVVSEDPSGVVVTSIATDGLSAVITAQNKPGVFTLDAQGLGLGQPTGFVTKFTATVPENPATHFDLSFS